MTPRHLPEEDPRSNVALAWGAAKYIYTKKKYKSKKHGRERKDTVWHATRPF
jgi:hypothetical protein